MSKTRERLLKVLVYYILVILVLQVIKAVLSKGSSSWSYFTGSILLSVQVLLTVALIIIPCLAWIIKKRLPGKRALLAACSVFVLLVAGMELLFGYWLHHPVHIPRFLKASYNYYYKERSMHVLQFDTTLCAYDPRLFYTLKPNSTGTFSNPEFTTHVTANRAGFRGGDQLLDSPAVICIGDSFTFGWGVEQQQAFSSRLQAIGGQAVLNAGIPSYGTAREIASLRLFDCSKLQYIGIQFCTNDIDENSAFIKRHDSLHISTRQEFESTARGHAINTRYYPGKHFSLIGQIWLKKLVNKIRPVFTLTGEYPAVNEQMVSDFLHIVAKAPVDFSKVKLLVYELDNPEDSRRFTRLTDSLVHTPAYQAIFKNSLKAVDMGKELTPQDYFELDEHINASGHQKVADMLNNEMHSH